MTIEEEIAKEVVKKLPVVEAYRDLAKPGVKEVGKIIENIVKTVHLAFLPFQVGAVIQDKLSIILTKSVQNVDPTKLIAPPMQIIGPVIEAIRFESEDTPIYEMFAELLTKAMDIEQIGLAHPSYPLLIRMLSADEAIMLLVLKAGPTQWSMEADLEELPDGKPRFVRHRYEQMFPMDKLTLPERVDFYLQHLYSLGLTASYVVDNQPIFSEGPSRKQIGTRQVSSLQLTPFGSDFIRACSKPESV